MTESPPTFVLNSARTVDYYMQEACKIVYKKTAQDPMLNSELLGSIIIAMAIDASAEQLDRAISDRS